MRRGYGIAPKVYRRKRAHGIKPRRISQQYGAYTVRFETTRNKLAELYAERLERIAKRTNIIRFLEMLKNRDGLITGFDEELWYITVENVKVYDGKRLIFTFKNGITVEIPAVK